VNPTPATVLGDRYALKERIAGGGMGEVWAATDTVLSRTVAVKLLSPALSRQGGLSAQATASILIQAATALEAAHQGGVVHRDVKPANILVTPDGTVKLTDFGISHMVNTTPLTQTGQVLGTAQYLSPEQVMGQSATASSDIYALGVVGHEMLARRRPFDDDTIVAPALRHINQPPPPLPDSVPVGIHNVISAALAKNPANRPATAAAMAHALGMPDASFTSGAPAIVVLAAGVLAPPAPAPPARIQAMPAMAIPTEPLGTPDRRSRLRPAWLLGMAAAEALVAIAAFALPGSDSTQTPAVVTATSASSNENSATPSTSATPVIAPPADTSAMPGQLDKAKGKARGHDHNKDGK